MESKKINQLATELAPDLSDITIIGDPTTGISKKITLSQMASLFTGTVEEYATLAAFPLVGVADTIYIALDTNIIYRYDTSLSTYVVLSPNIINSLVFSDANGFDGTITLVGSVATLSITTALTLGSVPFIGASGALTQDNSNLFFDDTNNRLGIATASPTTPLDVFGSGIIGRLNATSTNNAYLGFASNGTNKWSAGNVQSDHRFRIFSEANSAELITILQTGEFGIGIANPLTKLHIDGAATALIANLDANVSVAKSVSFRSDNSSRINLEVSGTESGSNVGADFFLRTFTDAGSLIETPLSIVRSTGVTTIKSLTLTNALSVANGGTGATSFTSGSILFSNGTLIAQDNTNLFWDDTNNRLGIKTATPAFTLDVKGDMFVLTDITIEGKITGGGGIASKMDIYASSNPLSTGVIKFYTANVERLQIGASGVTTIKGDGETLIQQATTVNSYIINSYYNSAGSRRGYLGFGGNSSSVFNVWNQENGDMTFGTNNTEKWRITSAGRMYNSNVTANNYALEVNGSTTTSQSYGLTIYGGTNSSDAALVVNNGTGSVTNLFKIRGDGNVGIGTSSPTELLVLSKATYPFIKLIETTANTSAQFGYDSPTAEWRMRTLTSTPLTFGTNDTERMRILASGNIAIGGTTSNEKLAIYGDMYVQTNITVDGRITGGGGIASKMDIYASSNPSSTGVIKFYTANAVRMTIDSSGNIGAPSGTNIYNASDIRLKQNVTKITEGLSKINALNPVKFNWVDNFVESENGKDMLGFIAQEIQNVIPEAVESFNNPSIKVGEEILVENPLRVNEKFIIPVLVKAIQELTERIKQLESK